MSISYLPRSRRRTTALRPVLRYGSRAATRERRSGTRPPVRPSLPRPGLGPEPPADRRLERDQRLLEGVDRAETIPVRAGLRRLRLAQLQERPRAQPVPLACEAELLRGRGRVPLLQDRPTVRRLERQHRLRDRTAPRELLGPPLLTRILRSRSRGLEPPPSGEALEDRDRDPELRHDRLPREVEREDIVLGQDPRLVRWREIVDRAVHRVVRERLRQPRGDQVHPLAARPRRARGRMGVREEILVAPDPARVARPVHRERERRQERALGRTLAGPP